MEINLVKELHGKLRGVIHVGAHEGQERDFYQQMGAEFVIWHEANPEIYKRLMDRLSQYPNQDGYNHAVSDFNGKIKFNVSNNDGSSSSILNLKNHKNYYPHINYEKQIEVDCVTLDEFYVNEEGNFNALFIDVQGAEYKVLCGAEKLLTNDIDYVYTEVNYEELYEGCVTVDGIDKYLSQFGFKRTHMHDTNHGWGDAFYQKVK
jgi:FkbM family methyltransferase